MSTLAGQLLIARPALRDGFFGRSVILMLQHGPEGAFGLVLNRSTKNKVGDALVANLPDTIKDETLYLGGPVQPQALSFLHNDAFIPDANVMPNLNLGHSLDSLLEISESFSTSQRLKIFAGYAGWSPGQLEDEMKRDTWMTHPASIDLVFHPNPDQLWKAILSEKGWKYRLIAEAPEDPSLN